MEKFIDKFNQSAFKLEPGESRVVYDSKTAKAAEVRLTNADNMKEQIHETMKELLRMAGIETRDQD